MNIDDPDEFRSLYDARKWPFISHFMKGHRRVYQINIHEYQLWKT